MDHLTEDTVVGLFAGTISAEERERAHQHMGVCIECRQWVAGYARAQPSDDDPTDPSPRRARVASLQLPTVLERPGAGNQSPAMNPAGRMTVLETGTMLGRYRVTEWLGQGGMGTVYAALDTKLKRKVALKLLSEQGGPADALEKRRERLLGEAQAMARLGHPNCVTIYDVGTYEGSVFLAMEFVDGMTLRSWHLERPRTPDEVLEIYLQAGRGLAAAHASGLVHRDFKPTNVMVGRDGRVRVMDFGLARASGSEPSTAPRIPDFDQSENPGTLTTAGAILGTPAYMPPEQLLGRTADPRSDQYSYCVSLFESLYGSRPFRVPGSAAEVMALAGETPPEPPEGNTAPDRLFPILSQGLRYEPAERFASMDQLLVALDPVPVQARRRRTRLGAVLGGLTATLVGLAWFGGHHNLSLCKGAPAEMAQVWNEQARSAMRSAFVATGKSFAAQAFDRTSAELDQYASSWVTMRTEACAATRIQGVQSDEVLRVRMDCLDQRKRELSALIELLSSADADLVSHASSAAGDLQRIGACADTRALLAPVPEPTDAEVEKKVLSLREVLAHAHALDSAGRYSAARDLLEPLAPQVRLLGYRPIEADVLFTLGQMTDQAGSPLEALPLLEEAALAAEAGRHDHVLASDLIYQMMVTGFRLEKFDQSESLSKRAEAALARLGNDESLEMKLHDFRGSIYTAMDKMERALEEEHLALDLAEKLLGSESEQVAIELGNMANTEMNLGRYDEALAHHQRSLELRIKLLGVDHPDVAKALSSIGDVLMSQGKSEEALAKHQQALSIQEAALGKDHLEVAQTLDSIGLALYDLGRYQEALADHQRSLEIKQRHLGQDAAPTAFTIELMGTVYDALGRLDEAEAAHRKAIALWLKASNGEETTDVLTGYTNLAHTLDSKGQTEEAIELLRKGIAGMEKALGPEHLNVARSKVMLGQALINAGDNDDAFAEFEDAEEIFEKAVGPDDPQIAAALTGEAQVYLDDQDFENALPLLERSLKFNEAQPTSPEDGAEVRFALAQAVEGESHDRVRARSLATEAKAGYEKAGPNFRDEADEVTRWLAKHR
jgi:serine/threonine protein kinase/tetratricopeptide (TPR) repeat protein